MDNRQKLKTAGLLGLATGCIAAVAGGILFLGKKRRATAAGQESGESQAEPDGQAETAEERVDRE